MYRYLLSGLLAILSVSAHAATIDLHIMAGQSNMQGWRSDAKFYPADPRQLDLKIPFYFEAVDYSSSQRYWDNLRPQEGHFLKGHFGPEVTFARSVKSYGFNPAIFKFSFGSSSIETVWKAPGQNGLYDRMIRELRQSISLLKQTGNTVNIRSFTWIQGETDASNDQLASHYYNNLKRMLHHFRRVVAKNPNLPVILGVDEQHPHVKLRPQVVHAQQRLSKENRHTAYTSMYGLEKSDVTHLTARGVIQHGQRIFQAYLKLAYPLNF
ncbi:MAG: sialate O-acetylesterase [Leucothrix sp.]